MAHNHVDHVPPTKLLPLCQCLTSKAWKTPASLVSDSIPGDLRVLVDLILSDLRMCTIPKPFLEQPLFLRTIHMCSVWLVLLQHVGSSRPRIFRIASQALGFP
jgi:hypothetical protein